MRCSAVLVLCACGRIGFSPEQEVVGCADGEREGFTDPAFTKVASCGATWSGTPNMRAAKTGVACGDDLGPCAVPADACAAGWHVCGALGTLDEILAIGGDACLGSAGPGAYAAAMSHTPDQTFGACDPIVGDMLPCNPQGWGGEPICCGASCNTPGCPDEIFPGGKTRTVGVVGAIADGCAAMPATRLSGVLCCLGGS